MVGVVSARLDAIKIAKATGSLSENVNFAIKSAVLRTFLDINDVVYGTRKQGKKRETTDVVDEAKGYTVLIGCYR